MDEIELASEGGNETSRAAYLVRSLLERHGLPRHRHASFVGEFFGLSRAASHQRINKSSPWTLDDFKRLADRFGEPMAQVLGAVSNAESGMLATLTIGGMAISCRVWLADDNTASSISGLVALEKDGALSVVPATVNSEESRRIAKLEIVSDSTPAPRVAVLDDDRDVANAVCSMLRSAGIAADPFCETEQLMAAVTANRFDGYVFDWLLPDGRTAGPLIAAVRSLPEHRAVVLLSGKTRDGTADPREIAEAMQRFKVQIIEKPALQPFLISALVSDGLRATRTPDGRKA